MSHLQINLSPDIIKLRNCGYEVLIKDNHLVIENIPYVNSRKTVCKGVLISKLAINQNNILPSKDHTVFFQGDPPCNENGQTLNIINNSNKHSLSPNLIADHMFSSKPTGGYKDYFHKMSAYIDMISPYAELIDSQYTPRTFRVHKDKFDKSSLAYVDTNATRASIGGINSKIAGLKIGIIGMGGTGSYILDSVSKTEVSEIHIFDSDVFSQHNAFRSPGATSYVDLGEAKPKVNYFYEMYSKMHNGIKAHNYKITSSNLEVLNNLDFIFIAIDQSQIKKILFEHLEMQNINFIDVGMGVDIIDDKLMASVRTCASVNDRRDHVWDRVSFDIDGNQDIYSTNIQLNELNSLNANIAVIKWKSIYGIYQDIKGSLFSVFNSNVNQVINEEDKA